MVESMLNRVYIKHTRFRKTSNSLDNNTLYLIIDDYQNITWNTTGSSSIDSSICLISFANECNT